MNALKTRLQFSRSRPPPILSHILHNLENNRKPTTSRYRRFEVKYFITLTMIYAARGEVTHGWVVLDCCTVTRIILLI